MPARTVTATASPLDPCLVLRLCACVQVVSSKVNFTRLNQNIREISYILPVQIPPFYSLIVRTLTILEGRRTTTHPPANDHLHTPPMCTTKPPRSPCSYNRTRPLVKREHS